MAADLPRMTLHRLYRHKLLNKPLVAVKETRATRYFFYV